MEYFGFIDVLSTVDQFLYAFFTRLNNQYAFFESSDSKKAFVLPDQKISQSKVFF